ncbi:MAG: restriction endonuclease subunit S [Clostridia bacterium]|nr:restriction endonuclease subunit S [Clostridia bacterium]
MSLADVSNGFTPFLDGDLLIAKITPCFENGKGGIACNLHGGLGFGSTEFHVLRPGSEIDARFLYYATLSRPFRDVGAKMMKGSAGQKRVPAEFLADFVMPLPDIEEQRLAARFLGGNGQLVSHLIRAKRRQIDLLNEQKQVIIHRAVTRGLDPDVRLRPSGIDWLSGIPEHWKSVRAGTLASSLQTGPFGSQLHAQEYRSNGIPVINPSHMANGKICPDPECAIGPEKAAQLSRHRLRVGDIVFARRGELGRCALVGDQEAGWFCGTGSLRMRLTDQVAHPEYMLQLFLSKGVAEWLSLQSVGATMDNLNTGILARLPLPLPPKDEQRAIIDYLSTQRAMIDGVIGRVQRQISLLQEYRTRLIADVVTGKLDVRNAELAGFDGLETPDDIEASEESYDKCDNNADDGDTADAARSTDITDHEEVDAYVDD